MTVTQRPRRPSRRSATACRCRRSRPGMSIHNLEMQPGGGAKLCRSAGVGATLTAREGTWAQITLPSGEVRRIPAACRATIGMVGNSDHMNIRLGKAGRRRWLGRRPARPRRGHEPGRPPDGRRRRAHLRRSPPVLADRQAGQGGQDPPPPQAVELGHHPPPQERPLRPAEGLTGPARRPPRRRRRPNGPVVARIATTGRSVDTTRISLITPPEGSGTRHSWDVR